MSAKDGAIDVSVSCGENPKEEKGDTQTHCYSSLFADFRIQEVEWLNVSDAVSGFTLAWFPGPVQKIGKGLGLRSDLGTRLVSRGVCWCQGTEL